LVDPERRREKRKWMQAGERRDVPAREEFMEAARGRASSRYGLLHPSGEINYCQAWRAKACPNAFAVQRRPGPVTHQTIAKGNTFEIRNRMAAEKKRTAADVPGGSNRGPEEWLR